MTVFPIPADSYLKGRFEINVDANYDYGNTILVSAYPIYRTDTNHDSPDTLVTIASVQIPAVGGYGDDTWFEASEVPGDLPHDIQQAVDSVIAQARAQESRGYYSRN